MLMRSRLRFTLLLPITALLACATSSTPTVTNPSYTPVGGDYVITVAAGTASASTFSGDLAVSGSSVSGSQDIPFTGTFANSTLTLTSSPFSSSVATINITLPLGTNTSGAQVASGTAVITGGTCALASTNAQAQLIPSFAGTWSGTLNGPVSGTASIVLTESAANSDGEFPATGGVTFTSQASSQCNFSVPISAPMSGLVSGSTLQVANSANTISITANAASGPVTFSVGYNTGSSACQGTYTGTLTN
jgi:hypothetical protein